MAYFGNCYQGKKVLITGHTGFKGSWLALWLQELGAKVIGVSKDVPTQPSHYQLLNLPITSVVSDINDYPQLLKVFKKYQPEIVFHLAAQALVRESYRSPRETLMTNVIGTANILEACRHVKSVRAVEIITSDKCYENQHWLKGYKETDLLGGFDLYSASKGCAEIVTAAYRRSFFPVEKYLEHGVLIASCRAGNVIGGGDWAKDRLIPDVMRAAAKNKVVEIRNPQATRPWQHVLEPLSGYLLLGSQLLSGQTQFAEAWNFGPTHTKSLSVQAVLGKLQKIWPAVRYDVQTDHKYHEADLLNLNCTKAKKILGWQSVWSTSQALLQTTAWYQAYYQQQQILSTDQLHQYQLAAQKANITWTKQ